MEPPQFPYSPNAYRDGDVVRSDEACACCGERRGWLSVHGAYAVAEIGELCPWCIADGSAHARLGASFHDSSSEEVDLRTPRFLTWQDWFWPDHCGEAAVYLGQPRLGELRRYPDAIEGLRSELRRLDWKEQHIEELIDGFDPGNSVIAYLFRCRRCAAHLAEWDAD